ncbi:MAG: hypothetical protein CME62_17980 [Halobacteriovoraceae bacterium]|nr:hypothetical protein [Halobacteriovoraceae bacterium]|tara:strand:+ start:14852 stop:15568 length:717 start_codon:yes stop_codon:yes gene_type:complete
MRFLIIFFLIQSTWAAKLPPRWRFEYNYGQAKTHYLEEQPSILSTNANIEQVADFHQFIYQYYLLPPWLDFSLGGNITGLSVQSPSEKEEQFQYLTAFANLGVVLPFSDFWNVKLIAEYFYTSMIVEDDAFGFRNLRGTQVYPEVEWLPFGSDMFFQVSPYLKVPLFSDVGDREETTIGLKFVFPLSGKNLKFPVYAYGKSIIVRVFYTNMRLEFERDDFIPAEIDVRQYGATLGFNF